MPGQDRPTSRGGVPLASDCASCFGLCCVALPFATSAEFPTDKAAGEPCRHLQEDFRCGIHAQLRERGWRGCTVFECFGAGQQVSQVTFEGRGWREDPDRARQMFAVFPVVRRLHEMLVHLEATLAWELPRDLREQIARTRDDVERLVGTAPDQLLALDVGDRGAQVGDLLARASSHVRGTPAPATRQRRRPRPAPGADLAGADLTGADLIGARLARADLRRAGLRGAYLIAADLSGARLRGADLLGADLRDADLTGADLTDALFLTQPQVDAARGDGRTRLPAALRRPAHWGAATSG